jgi:thiosulfate/3-mercaptopyruvate sulfurtransferase
MASHRHLVEPEWLKEHLDDPDLVVVDCRFRLQDPDAGRQLYREGHIVGAHFLDLNRDLSSPLSSVGGRHPLPEARQFQERLRALGVRAQSWVVAYDDEGSGAARLWWLLQFYGHPRVSVLNGGYPLWVARGYPVSSVEPAPSVGDFVARPELHRVVSHDVLRTQKDALVVIDARDAERFRGEFEPVDRLGGHIPGAINWPYKQLLVGPAQFPPEEQIRAFYRDLPTTSPVVYCGSGVSACVHALAMTVAGLQPVLYPGSWSDWIAHPDAPIARGSS